MTETVHVRTYQERRATLTTYDWQRRHYVQREHVRYVPGVQVVEWDDVVEPEPVFVGDEPTALVRRRQQREQLAMATLREHGPMTHRQLADAIGLAETTTYRICKRVPNIVRVARDDGKLVYGYTDTPPPTPPVCTPSAQKLVAAFEQHGAMTAQAAAREVGINEKTAYRALARYRDELFRVVETRQTQFKNTQSIWDIVRGDT